MSNYSGKDIKTLEGIEAVRKRPGMYIGDTGAHGLHHMLLEIISNSVDESLNGHGKVINISIKGKEAVVNDCGRGIPFDKTESGKNALVELATNLHSGGKFGQGGYSVSGGLHGVGITAVNALSSKMVIKSLRDNKIGIGTFEKGELIKFDEVEIDKNKVWISGTTVFFTPDDEIFGKWEWDYEIIKEKIQMLSFLTSGVKFNLDFNGKKEVFYSEEGLKDLVKTKAKNPITDVIYVREKTDIYDVEIALQYTENTTEKIFAFTNNIPNPNGGTHVTGLKRGMTNMLNKLAKEYGEMEKDKGNLGGDLLRKGLVAVVAIKIPEEDMIFQGQTKEKLATNKTKDGESIGSKVSKALTLNLSKKLSRKDLKTIIQKALIEKKAEDAAKRSREAAKKVSTGGKKISMVRELAAKLTDCDDRNGELWLLEGDSAAGSAKTCRNVKSQAILPLRGKVLNTHDKELHEILENKEVKDILMTLGCGIGEDFNIKNLRYGKIILLADADVDGGHINMLLMTLFLKHLPELITQGKIYRAVPPLYKVLKGKEYIYIQNDEELQAYIAKHGQPKEISRFKGIGEMDADDLWDTTMNPETRVLVPLTTKNMRKTLDLFKTLMGSDSKARREFIFEHASDMSEL